jgi:hypothetical protein
MNYPKQRLSALIVGGLSTMVLVGLPSAALAQNQTNSNYGMHQEYTSGLMQLNNSGASGVAHLALNGQTLQFRMSASGLTPNQVHPMHIHGKNNPEVAQCPTIAADTNHDGFISVVEGAPAYGPIKINLTSPQTPFGTPPTPALFAPFAGTPTTTNFPKADATGHETFSQTYVFNNSQAAQQAYASIMPLEDQHIVIHGAPAPNSVDADAFAALGSPVTGSPSTVSYDALLPVACGQIVKSAAATHPGQGNGTTVTNTGNNVNVNTGSSYHTSVSVTNNNNAQISQTSSNNLNTGNNHINNNIGQSSIMSGNANISSYFWAQANTNMVNIFHW